MTKEIKNELIINLRISPNASKNEIIKYNDGIKIKITAQPIDGKANKALIEFLSKSLEISKSSVKIIKGETSKDKTILIKTNDKEKLKFIEEMLRFKGK